MGTGYQHATRRGFAETRAGSEYRGYCNEVSIGFDRCFLFGNEERTAAAGTRSVTLPLRKVYKPPALSQQTFAAYSRTLTRGAAIFHVLLTAGLGLYFFFSSAGVKPANRFGGVRKKTRRERTTKDETNR